MFGNLNKMIKEGQERWDKIEKLAETINNSTTGGQVYDDAIRELILLVVEHLRPMNPSKEQINEATDGLTNLADLLKNLK